MLYLVIGPLSLKVAAKSERGVEQVTAKQAKAKELEAKMVLQWMILTYVVAAGAALAFLLTIPAPKLLKNQFVSLVSLILQPALFMVPFAGFQLLDMYWKNEHRVEAQNPRPRYPSNYPLSVSSSILSRNLTHTAVTPLDLVKCNMQIDPAKYKSIASNFGVLLKEQGVKGFFRGWVPTLLEFAATYKTLIYLAGSAYAEVIADVALCLFEAVKVRVQTQPGFARGLSDGFPNFVKSEGALG
ncbi:hypothetical protein ACFX2A_003026 [Malus domestica]